MKRRGIIFIYLFILSCSVAKPIPDWLSVSVSSIESYKKYYLSGRTEVAERQFTRALHEAKKTGNPEILARLYLIKMAVTSATLEELETKEYERLNALAPSPINETYFAFLSGNLTAADERFLPDQYRSFFKAVKERKDPISLREEIEKIDEPLSALIAVSVLTRLHLEDEAILKRAIEISSAQGWERPLLAYLRRIKGYYEQRNEGKKAKLIEKQINLLEQ